MKQEVNMTQHEISRADIFSEIGQKRSQRQMRLSYLGSHLVIFIVSYDEFQKIKTGVLHKEKNVSP